MRAYRGRRQAWLEHLMREHGIRGHHKRLHSTLSYTSPLQFLKDWFNPGKGEK